MPQYLQTLLDNQDYKANKGRYNFKAIDKKLRISQIKNRDIGYAIKGKIYVLIGKNTKNSRNVAFSTSKDTLTAYKELLENPSKEKYAEISAEISGIDKDFFIDLYDFANQKSFKKTWANDYTGKISSDGRGTTGRGRPKAEGGAKAKKEEPKKEEPKKRTKEQEAVNAMKDEMAKKEREEPIETRPREYDQENVKYKRFDEKGDLVMQEGVKEVKGKVLRTTLLENGEFGYVLKNKLFPMFKVDILASGSNSWSFVEDDMLPQEKELFKTMSELDDVEAMRLYKKFYNEAYNIPLEVINEAFKLANNEKTEKLIKDIGKNYGSPDEWNRFTNLEGFNLSNFDADQGNFETFMGYLRGFEIGNRADMKRYKFRAEQTEKSKRLRKEEFEAMSMSDEEIKKLFEGFEKDRKFRRRTEGGESKGDDAGIDAEEQEDFIDELEEEIKQQQAPPQTQPQPQTATASPPPDPPANNIQMSISEQVKGEALRLEEREKIAEQEENMKEELEKDNIADISKYGHQLAVQNIFKKNNKDFTYFKNLVSTNKSLNPSQDKTKRKITTDIIIAEYSSLFPIDNLKSDYDYEECLEIATFKFGFIENVRFERKWKKAIGNMNIGTPGNTDGLSAGAIVNLENMGLNVNQLLNQNPTANATTANATTAPPVAPTDPKKRETAGRVQRLRDYNIVRPPQNLKNKSTKKEKKVKFKEVNMNIRMKTINNRLLFTNLNHNPQQQNLEVEGDLPTFNFRQSDKKNRFKF